MDENTIRNTLTALPPNLRAGYLDLVKKGWPDCPPFTDLVVIPPQEVDQTIEVALPGDGMDIDEHSSVSTRSFAISQPWPFLKWTLTSHISYSAAT